MSREWKWAALIFALATLWSIGSNRWERREREQAMVRKVNDKRLRQLGLAIVRYVQKHGGVMPSTSSPEAMRKAITPYLDKGTLADGQVFFAADTQEPFQPSPEFSKLSMVRRENRAYSKDLWAQVVLYQASPSPNGTRAAVYGNGRIRRIREDDWLKNQGALGSFAIHFSPALRLPALRR